MKSIKNRKYLLLLGLVLLLILGLLLLFRDTVREIILIPVIYLFWLGGLILKSIDQKTLWLAFLIILFALTARSLFPSLESNQAAENNTRRSYRRGRVQFWSAQIQRMSGEGYATAYTTMELRKLILDVLSHNSRLSPRQIEQQILRGEWETPPEVKAVIESRSTYLIPEQLNLWRRIKKSLKSRMDGHAEAAQTSLEGELKVIIQYLNHEMEGPID